MAKDLPYFKFYINEWINGDVTLLEERIQGVFINVCCYYWAKECKISEQNLKEKFKKRIKFLQILIEKDVIKIENGSVFISFLDEQWREREEESLKGREFGRLGGRPKKAPLLETKPQGLPNKNPLRREEKRREENILKALCLVFGKQYKQPEDRMPAEVTFYRDIETQYDQLTEVHTDLNAAVLQILAYIKHCDNTGRKRIGTVHKLAEAILTSDWLVLNGDLPAGKKDPYEEARYNKTLLSDKAWREKYSDKMAFDKNFQKAFGYEKL